MWNQHVSSQSGLACHQREETETEFAMVSGRRALVLRNCAPAMEFQPSMVEDIPLNTPQTVIRRCAGFVRFSEGVFSWVQACRKKLILKTLKHCGNRCVQKWAELK
jgi:hypothetical protein